MGVSRSPTQTYTGLVSPSRRERRADDLGVEVKIPSDDGVSESYYLAAPMIKSAERPTHFAPDYNMYSRLYLVTNSDTHKTVNVLSGKTLIFTLFIARRISVRDVPVQNGYC